MNRIACDGVSAFHFDFHKNLSCPKLTCQDYYYSSKLTTYAFGVYRGETKEDSVYIWPQTIGPKNPDTVVSCLDLHLRENERQNKKWNIFWADNTRSQNKNFTVAFYFDHLVSTGFRERIDFKFFLAGHSFGAVDRSGGRTENIVLSKAEKIEIPRDYVDLMNSSSLHPRITWREIEQENLKSFSTWLRMKYTEKSKDVYGNAYRFSDTMHFNYGIGERVDPADGNVKTYSHPGIVWLRKTLDPTEEPIEVDFRKSQRTVCLKSKDLVSLNQGLIKPPSKTCKDLGKLCKFLSPRGKEYYATITSGQ